jgi:hypothetical protein
LEGLVESEYYAPDGPHWAAKGELVLCSTVLVPAELDIEDPRAVRLYDLNCELQGTSSRLFVQLIRTTWTVSHHTYLVQQGLDLGSTSSRLYMKLVEAEKSYRSIVKRFLCARYRVLQSYEAGEVSDGR